MHLAGMLFLLTYSIVMFLLCSFAVAPVVSVMQASSLAALIISKVVYMSISELLHNIKAKIQ